MTSERAATGGWPMADRSLLPTVLGIPPVVAVGLAAGLTGLGVFVDLARIGSLGLVFTVCHIVGCLLAVIWVRRGGLFGPMVQPPLLVAVSVPVVVLLAGEPAAGQGIAQRLLVIGAPLVNAFPIMAWSTGLVLAVGAVRLVAQRPLTPPDGAGRRGADTGERDAPADGASRRGRREVSDRPGSDAARGAARRSASPRRS